MRSSLGLVSLRVQPFSPPAWITALTAGQWTRRTQTSDFTAVKFDWNSPGYPPAGGASAVDLFGVWAGAAYDVTRRRMYFHGGGHGSYDGNEFYYFDVDTGTMRRVNNPSPYTEGDAVNGLLPDGLPLAIHTYGSIECDDAGVIYQLTSGGSSLANIWKFNPNHAAQPFSAAASVAAWTNTGSPNAGGSQYGDGHSWDAATQKFYGIQNQNQSNFVQAESFTPATNTRANINTFPPNGFAPGNYTTTVIDPTRRRLYMIGGAFNGSGSYIERGTIYYHIDNQTWTDLTGSTTGSKAPESAGGYGGTYDSWRDRIVLWHGGKNLYDLNPVTNVWTLTTPAGSTPFAAFSQGTFNKFRYVAAYDVFIGCCGATESQTAEVWAYKPPNWRYA